MTRLKPHLLVLLLAAAGCHKADDGAAASKDGKDAKKGGSAIPVRVVTAQKKLSPRIVYAVAALAGRQQADVYSKVIGRVTYLGPKEGQPVKAGEILFRVDRSDPGESYLNAPTPSPVTGWVGRWRVVNVGEQVTPTDPVVTVVDDQALRAVVYLPASDWLEVKPETRVTAELERTERDAKVLFIARAADLTSGRGSVTVELPNPKRDWRAGMYARFRFELSPKERILVSATSLIITDQGAFVYVADGEKAKRIAVTFRVVDGDTVEILSGLSPDSRVVTAGVNLLGDQSAIHVVD